MRFDSFASSSAGNLYTVTDDDGHRLAIECGMSMARMRETLDFKLAQLDGVLVSHSHDDHCRAARDIMRAGGTHVYASHQTLKAIESGYLGRVLSPGIVEQIGAFHVLPFETHHDTPGSLGFVVLSQGDALLFAIDTSHVPVNFVGLTHIALECNFALDLLRESHAEHRTRVVKNHLGLDRVVEYLSSCDLSKVRQIHLLHLSDAHSDEARFQKTIESATGIPTYVAKK